MSKVGIHIIEPAGTPDRAALSRNIVDLERRGFRVRYTATPSFSAWSYASGSATDRCHALHGALCNDEIEYVVAARGGYGASDLLPLLDWDRLSKSKPKCLVGLSDVTALQLALYSRLGWRGLHAVMPGGSLWVPGESSTEQLVSLLEQGPPWREKLPLQAVTPGNPKYSIEGILLGGCLAVLTNLIGTPYQLTSWDGYILFIEDTHENPGRLMRFWNQWIQCGALDGLAALVVGQLVGIEDRGKVLDQFAARSPCPVFSCDQFGHQKPSFAVGQGAQAHITGNDLHWEIDEFQAN